MPTGSDAVLVEGEAPASVALPLNREASSLEGVILRILQGETNAFEELMVLTESRILGLAWRLLQDRELARDAAQETYLRIYRSLDRFRLGENFQAWMYRIAVNVCCDLAKKRGPFTVPEGILETLEHASWGSAEESILLAQRRAMVRRALGTLPPAERSALVLRDLEGLRTEEVARILGVRAGTVRSQISSARTKVQAFCARLTRAGGSR